MTERHKASWDVFIGSDCKTAKLPRGPTGRYPKFWLCYGAMLA